MKKELLFYDEIDAKAYLRMLYDVYPYDIEEHLVMSLLDHHTNPHPVLILFIQFFQTVFKIHVVTKQHYVGTQLHTLFEKMCAIAQLNDSLLYTHQYAFDVTYHLTSYTLAHPYAHLPLSQIPFITHVQLHTIPFITLPKLTHKVSITLSSSFIYHDISMDATSFIAVYIKIEDRSGVVFLSKECASFITAIGAMYPIIAPEERYDFMLLFALKDVRRLCTYYFDETNQLYIGLVCGDEQIRHFSYLKEMILTLYNTICIQKQDLPIHASMMEVGPTKKGIVFAGITSSGKSEMLDAFGYMCEQMHKPYAYLYDDSGILHYLDNVIVSTGSEVAACRDIHGMHREALFQDVHNSIFLKEEQYLSWQIIPLTTHARTMEFHSISALCYLNAHADFKGIRRMVKLEDIQKTFLHDPYSNEFFCGSFGCSEQQQHCETLLCDFLTVLFVQNIPIIEVSTHGHNANREKLFQRLAKELFALLNI